MASKENKPQLINGNKRLDGRAFDELRPLKIEANVLKNADGSAYLELGNNKVLAAVYGPREVFPRHTANQTKAVIKCRYSMAPFSSLEGHGRSGPNRRAIEISKVIKEVFESTVLVDNFPGSQIDIYIEILQGDGGTRAAGITAAAVAMASAGIPMKDMVYGIAAGRVDEHIILDLDMIEDNYSNADMPVAISPRNGEMLLLQMDGGLTHEQFKKACDLIMKAGEIITKAQKEALKNAYKTES